MRKVIHGLLSIFLSSLTIAYAQQGEVKGRVFDKYSKAISEAKVFVRGSRDTVYTDSSGKFTLSLDVGTYLLAVQHPMYKLHSEKINVRPAATLNVYVKLLEYLSEEVLISDERDGNRRQDPDHLFVEEIPIEPVKLAEVASVKSDLGSLIATLGQGASTNNEFSSQYRVRGGNFDENLIYVNDIQIYRPFLVRSGQQEGLGFVNTNLVESVRFSSGGFAPKYADKMSSVLDVTYKTPDELHGSAELGILAQNIHLEGSFKQADSVQENVPGRLTYLFGGRRFSPSYVLNSLDVQGDYTPSFYDAQLMLTFLPKEVLKSAKVIYRKDSSKKVIYFPKRRFKVTGFFHFANNNYQFQPSSQETTFGTFQSAFKLQVAFLGQEISAYSTGLAALMLEHRPTVNLSLRYTFSAFRTVEAELFDVEGGYRLSDINIDFGADEFNEVVFDRGIGTYLRHARNYLVADVLAAEHRADWLINGAERHKLSWGFRAQRDKVDDQLKEWYGVDSAGYFELEESYRSNITFDRYQFKAYLQDQWKLSADKSKRLIIGLRGLYNSLNEELVFSPRIQFVLDPSLRKGEAFLSKQKNTNYQLRFAAGMYHQPAFYREMRSFDGSVNLDKRAQRAFHLIAGGDYYFNIGNRPFKLFAEAYYKYLDRLVPYQIDNVRIRYFPFYDAKGYAYGLDTRLSGEFISGVESWVSMGLLKTGENVASVEQGYVPRPADQRFTLGLYFQDELPANPTYKVNLNLVYGSGLPFGVPGDIERRVVFRSPSYMRADLGFSKLVLFKPKDELDIQGGIQSLWIAVEIFNIFQRANTVAYTWVEDVYTNRFAVPNYLSARLLNFRAILRF